MSHKIMFIHLGHQNAFAEYYKDPLGGGTIQDPFQLKML